jgi:hypothetical protein
MTQAIDANTNEIFRDRDQPKTLQEKLNKIDGPGVRYTTDEVDIYRYQDNFDPEGFDPFNSKNYQHWSEKETWSSALGKGMDSFATRFGNTYVDSFASYGRMADALFSWDWDKMMPSADEMDELNWAEYKESMKNFVFIDPSEEEDIISKRSVSEFLGNAGFALGTIGALGTELVADAALTYITGGAGAGSFAATAAKFTGLTAMKAAAKQGLKSMGLKGMAKVGDFVGDVGRGAFQYANESAEALAGVAGKAKQAETLANAGKIGSNAFRESAKEVLDIMSFNTRKILKSKSFDELALNIAKGVPLVGTGIRYGEKIVAGAKGGLSTGKLIGIGLQGTRRMAQELNMSSTEAGFEAVTTYGSTLDLMIKNHEEKNGEPPTPEQFAKMQEKAWQAAGANYNTNLALLMATNRLQFGGLFSKWAGANKWTKELLEEGAEKSFGVNRMWKSSKLVGKTYEKGFFGTYGLTGKIAKDFGKKQAVYEFGKQFLKDATKFQVSEGLQENLQETSASAWMNYYAGQYNGTKYTLQQAFGKGIDEQFSKQGLRTFLQGALTGVLIGPAVKVQQFAMDKLQQATYKSQYADNPSANPYTRMKEQLKKDIDLQNQFFNQLSNKKLEDNIVTFTSHVQNTLDQTEAAARGAQYEWQNAQDNLVLAGALAANRTGTISAYRQAIRQMGEDMSDQEFETAFGIKLEDTKYKSAAEFTSDMASDVGRYSDTIDAVRKKAKSLPDPMMYEEGSKDQITAIILHNAQEEAIKIMALNQLKGARAKDRATKLTQELMSIPGFENSSDYAIRVLTNPDNFTGEKGNIQAEIRLLQEGMESATPEMKQELTEKIKLKKRKLELIDKWLGFWDNMEVEEDRVDTKTGATVKGKTTKYTHFKGVEETVVEKDENGNVTNPKGIVYKLDHSDIVNTFKEFVNIVNQEAGINTRLTEQAVYEGIDKIVDYIRLEKDAKDYLNSVDVLFNPENYRQLVGRIQDGRLKYELLELLDSINSRMRGSIAFAFQTSVTEDDDLVEHFKKIKETTDKVLKDIKEFDAYKNLLAVVTSEEFGINSSQFVKENLKKLDDFILAKMSEIFDNYAAIELTDDIDDQTYSTFKTTGKVSELTLNMIARKLKKRDVLTVREGEVYDKFKNDIIDIKKFLDENIEIVANEISEVLTSNNDLIDSIKQRLVETNEFSMDQLDELENTQLYDMAFDRGLISVDDLAFGSTNSDIITDEVIREFENTGKVPDNIMRNIALKDIQGFALSDREQQILDAKRDEITEIQNQESPENNPNPPVEEDEEETNVPTENETIEVPPTTEGTQEPVKGDGATDGSALLEQMFGVNPTVTGTEEDGFNVAAGNGTLLNNQPVDTQEEAEKQIENLNTAYTDNDWAAKFLQSDDLHVITAFMTMAKASMRGAKTTATTLEDYYKTPNGKKSLNEAKNAAKEGFTTLSAYRNRDTSSEKQEPVIATGTQVELFDTTSSIVDGPAVTMASIQSLHEDLLEMMESKKDTSEIDDLEKRKKQSLSEKEWSTGPVRGAYLRQEPDGRWSSMYFKPSKTGINGEGIYANTKEEVIAKIEAKYAAELAALKGKPVPSTTAALQPKDLKLNVSASTKKAGMESITKQDSSIESFDENKFIRVTKANADDVNGKYYTIDNGVLRIRINGRDAVSGRTGGATQISVKVPVGFNEKIFAEKLKNISHKDGVTTDEAVQQVVNDVRNAIVESQKSTTKVSEKIDTFVEKGDVTEQNILDQLDDIHSCF